MINTLLFFGGWLLIGNIVNWIMLIAFDDQHDFNTATVTIIVWPLVLFLLFVEFSMVAGQRIRSVIRRNKAHENQDQEVK